MSGGVVAGAFFGVLFIALFIEWITEFLFGKVLDKVYIKVTAILVGVALACLLQLDILKLLFGNGIAIGSSDLATWTLRVLTGMIAGGGSNVVHNLIGKYLPASKDV